MQTRPSFIPISFTYHLSHYPNSHIYHVTTLADDGPGSLWIVFEVSGIIHLSSYLKVLNWTSLCVLAMRNLGAESLCRGDIAFGSLWFFTYVGIYRFLVPSIIL
ncbi:unnamed protein product, partial [Vitis vinifera]|uniref:Uncharacterized protein n=1 Tax=Vitis vinifera TaxID=29760 RepID=D7TKI6_VITVI